MKSLEILLLFPRAFSEKLPVLALSILKDDLQLLDWRPMSIGSPLGLPVLLQEAQFWDFDVLFS
jgi:hypothetical protein